MALSGSGKVVVEWEAKLDRYLKDLGKAKDLEEFMRKSREKDFKAQEKHYDQIGKALSRTAEESRKIGTKWREATKEVSLMEKGLDLAGKRVKAMGMSLVSGLGAGLIGGVLGGGVSSVVQALFAPLTEEQIDQMARGTREFVFWGDATKDLTKALIEKNKAQELRKEGRSDAAQAVEAVTHANATKVLAEATKDLGEQFLNGDITAGVYADALKHLQNQFSEATGSAEDFKKALDDLNKGDLDIVMGLLGRKDPKEAERKRRAAERKREREREADRQAEFSSFEYQQGLREEAQRLSRQFGGSGEFSEADAERSKFDVLAMQREREKEQTEAQIKLNEKLAETYVAVGSGIEQMVSAFAEGGMSGEKAARLLTKIVLNSVRDRALAEAKLQFGLAAIPPGNPAAFAAGIALTAAAGLAGGLAGRWGGTGGGGGSSGGGYGGGPPVMLGSGGRSDGQRTIVVFTSVDSSDSQRVKTEQVRNQVGRALGQHGVRGA